MGTGPHLSLHTAMDLVQGLDRDELFLDYQPVISLDTGRVESVEALVRWRHPERGVLSPDAFLPQAQRSRLGCVITSFVLRAAVEQWMAWRDAGLTLRLAVNVPPIEMVGMTVPDEVRALVAGGFDPTALTIEITERRIPDLADIGPAISALRDLGVRLSIDDFGTGDSSLVRVQELEFNEIKIDRSFVAGVAAGGSGHSIVRFATQLAHNLGMDVVAEGVEDEQQLRPLRDLDVDLVQGFHLGRPGTPEALQDLLVGA